MTTAEITYHNNEKKEIEINGYDLTLRGIINFLNLDKPQYKEVAQWGSFGNNFIWDK
jgi:S-adenosylmethionine synthetase